MFIIFTILLTWQLLELLKSSGTPGEREQLRNPEILEHLNKTMLDTLVSAQLSLPTQHTERTMVYGECIWAVVSGVYNH